MAKITVALVEDHALVRQAFRRLLEDSPFIRVVGEGSTGLDAVELVRQHHPDVILLDMVMPELNGLEAAEQIRRLDPRIRLIIVSIYSDEAYVKQAMRVGVTGYILKDAVEMDLARAVVSVAEGRPYLSPAIAEFLMNAAHGGQLNADFTKSGRGPFQQGDCPGARNHVQDRRHPPRQSDAKIEYSRHSANCPICCKERAD